MQVPSPTNSVRPGGKIFIAKSDRSRDRERNASSESEVSVYIEVELGESRITWNIRQTWTVALLKKTLTWYKYDHTRHIRSHNDQTYNTHTQCQSVVTILSPSQELLDLKKVINQGSEWQGDRLVRYQVGGFNPLYVHKRFRCFTFGWLLWVNRIQYTRFFFCSKIVVVLFF